jgi:hypothetical protein
MQSKTGRKTTRALFSSLGLLKIKYECAFRVRDFPFLSFSTRVDLFILFLCNHALISLARALTSLPLSLSLSLPLSLEEEIASPLIFFSFGATAAASVVVVAAT